jgi:glycosyltransferase involved in cell wall biosynthesis
MKISIAMATYNGAEYLSKQLQSFIDQTRQPDELVISDDGSADSTMEIVEEFAKTAPFEVRCSRNEQNLGYAGNFNVALMRTTGDLVLLSDQDDVWFPDKISRLVELAENNPAQLVYMNDAALTDAELNEVGLTKLGQIHSAGLNDHYFVMGCCCAIRRELLDLCLPIPAGYKAHDKWIVRFADGVNARLICERVLQYYRRHGNNESHFIVNRLKKTTKWSWCKVLISSNWPPVSEAEELAGLQQKQLLLEGVERALGRDNGEYTVHLQAMESEIRAFLQMMERRREIRRKWLLSRLVASLTYWVDGGYRNASGLQSVVRDVLGDVFPGVSRY